MNLIRMLFDKLTFWWMWTDRVQRNAWRIMLSIGSSSFFMLIHGWLMKIENKNTSNFMMVLIGASIISVCSIFFEQAVRSKQELQKMYAELEEKNIKLQEAALRDTLTKLYNNRDFMMSTIQMLSARAKRKNSYVYFFFADLDDFKQINSNYGHVAGDDALRAAAKTFQESFRDEDCVFRYGGDEFLTIFYVEDMPNQTAKESVALTVTRVMKNVENIWVYGTHKKRPTERERIDLSISIGAICVDLTKDPQSELERASKEMTEVKKENKRVKQESLKNAQFSE